jgi:hypothetical protein
MTKRRVQPKWLRLTEETNALDFLERAAEFIRFTESDRKAWKWVVLALHGALYGFAIAACKGTTHEIVIRRTKKGEERLISLDDALKMCQDERWMSTLITGQALNLTDSQKESIRKLKKTLRNNFEHYVPRGWSIEIHGLPRIAIDVLDVVRFLAVDTGRYQQLNQSQRRKVKSIVFQSKRLLMRSNLYQEALLAEKAEYLAL